MPWARRAGVIRGILPVQRLSHENRSQNWRMSFRSPSQFPVCHRGDPPARGRVSQAELRPAGRRSANRITEFRDTSSTSAADCRDTLAKRLGDLGVRHDAPFVAERTAFNDPALRIR